MKRWVWGARASLLVIAASANAQPVYRSVGKGAVVYSHEPCIGAEVVDTTLQGLDKSSGQSRKGADVVRNGQTKQG